MILGSKILSPSKITHTYVILYFLIVAYMKSLTKRVLHPHLIYSKIYSTGNNVDRNCHHNVLNLRKHP